jgi:hypothetical protein
VDETPKFIIVGEHSISSAPVSMKLLCWPVAGQKRRIKSNQKGVDLMMIPHQV